MLNPKSVFFWLLCGCLQFPVSAYANLVDMGKTTLDASTGLEWLDLTETEGIAFLDVADELSETGRFSGYRHATEDEVLHLLYSLFGLDMGMAPANETHLRFLELFGVTSQEFNFYGSSYGYADAGEKYGQVWGQDYYMTPVFGLSNLNYMGEEVFIFEVGQGRNNPAISFPGVGSFLVRDASRYHPIPEIDGALAPLALGLLSLSWLILREREQLQHQASDKALTVRGGSIAT